MTIYMVSDGQSGDFGYLAAFSSEEKAQEFVKHIGMIFPEIDKFELDEMADVAPLGLRYCYVRLNTDGTVREAGVYNHFTDERSTRLTYVDPLTTNSFYPYYNIDCWARGKQHAVKIAGEQLMQHKAEQQQAQSQPQSRQT